MKLLIQRVLQASVEIDGETKASINAGLLVFVGFGQHDTSQQLKVAAEKVVNIRLFADDKGRFKHSLLQCDGELLLVPQFTLYADTRSGRRPDFKSALSPDKARQYFYQLSDLLTDYKLKQFDTGVFAADMKIKLINDGPVTIMLEV